MVWYVIQEYETYNEKVPNHAWKLIKTCKDKASAEKTALDFNFEEYCKGKDGRYPPEIKPKTTRIDKDTKYKIVVHVLKNINSKTGSSNGHWGTGFYIIDDSRIKLEDDATYIPNIKELLEAEKSEKQRSQSIVSTTSSASNAKYSSSSDEEEEESSEKSDESEEEDSQSDSDHSVSSKSSKSSSRSSSDDKKPKRKESKRRVVKKHKEKELKDHQED